MTELSLFKALDFCTSGCYQGGFDQIYYQSTRFGAIHQFTFLRLDQNLLSGNNWSMFRAFVSRMHGAGNSTASN